MYMHVCIFCEMTTFCVKMKSPQSQFHTDGRESGVNDICKINDNVDEMIK